MRKRCRRIARALKFFDRGVDDRVVWNRYQRIFERTDTRASEADILDRALASARFYIIADAEGFLKHDQHRAEQVREAVAGRKRHGDTSDAQSGHDRVDGETEFVGALNQEPNGDDNTGEAHTQPDQLAVQATPAQMLRRGDRLADHPACDN